MRLILRNLPTLLSSIATKRLKYSNGLYDRTEDGSSLTEQRLPVAVPELVAPLAVAGVWVVAASLLAAVVAAALLTSSGPFVPAPASVESTTAAAGATALAAAFPAHPSVSVRTLAKAETPVHCEGSVEPRYAPVRLREQSSCFAVTLTSSCGHQDVIKLPRWHSFSTIPILV